MSVSGAMGSRPSSEEHHEGLFRPSTKPPRPRGLQEAGRQSSTDSGIATGSHSSYSGSFSSYTGSLDTTQGEIEEFGSAMSLTLNTNSSTNLTANPNTPTSTSNTNPRLPPPFQTSSTLASPTPLPPGHRLCICPIIEVTEARDLEYQVPVQLLQHYDTPRRLIQPHPSTSSSTSSSTQEPECGPLEPLGSSASPKLTAPMRLSGSGDGVLPPGGFIMQRHILCPLCGGLKVVGFFSFLHLVCLFVCTLSTTLNQSHHNIMRKNTPLIRVTRSGSSPVDQKQHHDDALSLSTSSFIKFFKWSSINK